MPEVINESDIVQPEVINEADIVPEHAAVASTAPQQAPTSVSESAGRGFANAGSFGVGKWANALYGAYLNRMVPNAGGVEGAIEASTPMTGHGFWADVLNSVEGQKKENANAFQSHPAAYIAGSLAPAAANITSLARGAATMGAIPSTVGGAIKTGAAVGAATGATESTNLQQLATNTTAGGLTGGVLGALPGAAQALVNKVGISSAVQRLDNLIAGAQGMRLTKTGLQAIKDEDVAAETSQNALAELHKLVSHPNATSFTERDLIQAARDMRSALQEPAASWANISGSVAERAPVIRAAGPSVSQIGGDVLQMIPGAGVLELGHMIGGTPGAIIQGAGALAGLKPAGHLVRDVVSGGAHWAAGSPTFQAGLSASPLAGGSVAGQAVQPLGLSGALGQYIDEWRK